MVDEGFEVEINPDGKMKFTYEQFHIMCLSYQQRIMLQRGSMPVREAMLDHEWFSIPRSNKDDFMERWEGACKIEDDEFSVDRKQKDAAYLRINTKTQIISDVLLAIGVINYAPPNELAEIIKAGILAKESGEVVPR